jgi:hypothetical protein
MSRAEVEALLESSRRFHELRSLPPPTLIQLHRRLGQWIAEHGLDDGCYCSGREALMQMRRRVDRVEEALKNGGYYLDEEEDGC